MPSATLPTSYIPLNHRSQQHRKKEEKSEEKHKKETGQGREEKKEERKESDGAVVAGPLAAAVPDAAALLSSWGEKDGLPAFFSFLNTSVVLKSHVVVSIASFSHWWPPRCVCLLLASPRPGLAPSYIFNPGLTSLSHPPPAS
ncbi:hypothetical protein PIB30_065456 [Stylosanthes scabra]|uniref:Uncharacterized protein n=1 Tax=Stylosanthes scabra TaxID=79078 RepID=A0ABU6YNE7_9FABA|nr:hypothetical protein [Stylosanthes scabra]